MNLSDTPVWFRTKYIPASTVDIKEASFGAILRKRPVGDESWKAWEGALLDQRIFGPYEDDRCACGHFSGSAHRGIICHKCGVRIGPKSMRWQRMAHINLPDAIAHPWSKSQETINAIPILPAAYLESEKGASVAHLYETILDQSLASDTAGVAASFDSVIAKLLPLAIQSLQWNLPQQDCFTLGLCLVPKPSVNEGVCCSACGYPLDGLAVSECPHCKSEL